MKDLEDKIEKAADSKYTRLSANPPYCEIKDKGAIRGFIQGAKSPEAKEYWFSIFQSEKSETEKRLDEYIKNNFDSKSSYSEEEVISLIHKFGVKLAFKYKFQYMFKDDLASNFTDWFEQNKKK